MSKRVEDQFQKIVLFYGAVSACLNIFNVLYMSVVQYLKITTTFIAILLHLTFFVFNLLSLRNRNFLGVIAFFHLSQVVFIMPKFRMNFTPIHLYLFGPDVYVDILSLFIGGILLWTVIRSLVKSNAPTS